MLREFVDMSGHSEFRCFVHCRKLVAISQANPYHVDEALSTCQDKVALFTSICGFLSNSILHLIEYEDVTIDVVLLSQKVFVIEMNSFGPDMFAGSAMFDWIADSRTLLAVGGGIVVCRYLGEDNEMCEINLNLNFWKKFT